MRSEINPMPLLRRLAAGGRASWRCRWWRGAASRSIMRAWSFGAPLEAGVWGIRAAAGRGAGGRFPTF